MRLAKLYILCSSWIPFPVCAGHFIIRDLYIKLSLGVLACFWTIYIRWNTYRPVEGTLIIISGRISSFYFYRILDMDLFPRVNMDITYLSYKPVSSRFFETFELVLFVSGDISWDSRCFLYICI